MLNTTWLQKRVFNQSSTNKSTAKTFLSWDYGTNGNQIHYHSLKKWNPLKLLDSATDFIWQTTQEKYISISNEMQTLKKKQNKSRITGSSNSVVYFMLSTWPFKDARGESDTMTCNNSTRFFKSYTKK